MLLQRLGPQPTDERTRQASQDRPTRPRSDAAVRFITVAAAAVLTAAGAVPVLVMLPVTDLLADVLVTAAQSLLAGLACHAWWRWRSHHDRVAAPLLALFGLLLTLNYLTGAAGRLTGLEWPALTMAALAACAHLVFLAALFQLSRGGRSLPGWIELTQSTALFVLVLGMVWTLLPEAAEITLAGPGRRTLLYLYVGANLLGLVGAWSVLLRQRERALPGVGLVCLAQVVMAATSTGLIIHVLTGTYQPLSVLDLGWLVAGGLLVAAAATRRSPRPGWLRARQRVVLVASLLLVVGAMALSVTSVVQGATVRLAEQQERATALRHASAEITRLRALEAQRPLDAEEAVQVLRSVARARLDIATALVGVEDLPTGDPLRWRLTALPALLLDYQDELTGPRAATVRAREVRGAGETLARTLEQVTEDVHARSAADLAALGRRAAVAQVGVPLGLLVLGLAFVSSWTLLRHRERALERADAWQELTREVVGAQERERARIAADLHDGPLQQVAAWRIKVEMIVRRLGDDPAAARALLDELDDEVAEQAVELRRVMHALRPPVLDELGFGAAVRKLAEDAAKRGRFGVRVDTTGLGRLRCDREVETLAYRILQEVLTNVAKHAEAAKATVDVRAADNGLRLRVVDDGRGMPPLVPAQLVRDAHFGLAGVTERVELVGGKLRVSSAPQRGTAVEAWLPAALEESARAGRE